MWEAKERRVLDYQIACPYRGVYQVGLRAIYLEDSLGFFKRKFETRTQNFYVYPQLGRVSDLQGFNEENLNSQLNLGLEKKDDICAGIREYRSGEPLRMLLKKRFYETGQLWIKEPEPLSPKGLCLALDLCRDKALSAAVLEAEDQVFEAVFSLLKVFAQEEIPVELLVWVHSWITFEVKNLSDFNDLFETSMQLMYGDKPGLEDYFLHWNTLERNRSLKSTFIFTNRWIPAYLQLLEKNTEIFQLHLYEGLLSQEEKGRLRAELDLHPGAIHCIFSGAST